MREILFRGKRDENDEWVFGDLIHEPWASCIQVTEQVIENNNIDIFKHINVRRTHNFCDNGKSCFFSCDFEQIKSLCL